MTAWLARPDGGSSRTGKERFVLVISVTGLTVVVGLLSAVLNLVLIPVLLVMLAAVLIPANGFWRAAVLIAGGLIVLQESPGLDLPKFAYLGGSMVALGFALAHVRDIPERWVRVWRPLRTVAIALLVLVGLSLPVAALSGNDMVTWLRNSIPYLLFAAMPLFAIDLALTRMRRPTVLFFAAVGVLAAASYAVRWVGAGSPSGRNLADLPVGQLLFPSLALAEASYCYAVGMAMAGKRRRLAWAGFSAVIVCLLIFSGSRAVVPVLVAPIVVLMLIKGTMPERIRRGIPVIAMSLAILAVATISAVAVTGLNAQQLSARLSTIPSVVLNPEVDPSYRGRLIQTRAALAVFQSSPLVGKGPGYLIGYVDEWSGSTTVTTLDSPAILLSQFGLAGVAVLGWSAVCLVILARRLRSLVSSPLYAAICAFLLVIAASIPFGDPFADKGISFGLLLLISTALMTDPEPQLAQTNQDFGS